MSPPTAARESPLLEARDVVKTFPGVRALDGVGLELRRGEVHALVGENGAGKSTLIHVIGGICQADSGQIFLEGERVALQNAHQAAQHGIGVVFQDLSLAPNLSVAENIFANRQPVRRWNLIRFDRLYADAQRLLELFELRLDCRTPAKSLPVAQQQVVEFLKAISNQPRVLILDEPTSSLTSVEIKLLFENIRRLKARGISFIYISHHLPEIFAIADRVTVLRDGRRVATCKIAEVTAEEVVRKMVGRELVNMYGTRASPLGEEYFRVEGLARGDDFRDVSFSLRRGEILGLAGLVGAGRTQLGRAIFGLEPPERGQIFLEGEPLRIRSPREAIARRVGYMTEDRREQGLFAKMAIRDNCIAPSLGRFADSLGFMKEREVTDFANQYRKKFNLQAPSVFQQVRNLSGGNQQKVLLSMWMGIQPKLLIADEPTRGVDVGAKSEIYRLLRGLAATGAGVILISSDLPEVLGVSDRVLVMRGGRLVGEFAQEEATEEKVIASATGLARPAN